MMAPQIGYGVTRRTAVAAVVLAVALALASAPSRACAGASSAAEAAGASGTSDASGESGWISGEFQSTGKPVEEFHCVPPGSGPFPAVVLLHGAGMRGFSDADFEKMCTRLAGQGYYAEFIEYYSQTDPLAPGFKTVVAEVFPVWMAEVRSGIDAMGKNRSIDSRRIALMGFSMGGYLATACGAVFPAALAAIVEYYGGLPRGFRDRVKAMPPMLIIHGDADTFVPVSEARELDAMLTQAGRPHEIHIYRGSEHGFNLETAFSWYNKADAEDAWEQSLVFLDKYVKHRPPN